MSRKSSGSPLSNCYCTDLGYRKCVHCQETDDREEDRAVCSSWNWNCTPRECAQDARDRDWDYTRLRSAMVSFGFNPRDIKEVLNEFESI